MSRRTKSFAERRQELAGALTVLAKAIQAYEESKNIHHQIAHLRVVAGQLRALVVLELQQRSFKHPLLIDLAKEMNFPLVVYTIDKTAASFIKSLPGLVFFSTGDALSLTKERPHLVEIELGEALEEEHTSVGSEQLSIKQVIRLIGDTEATHYDPARPEILDNLEQIELMGLPSAYRTIYSVGKIVRDLGFKFLEATT